MRFMERLRSCVASCLKTGSDEVSGKAVEYYRDIVENGNSIILEMDRSGNIVYLNAFAQNFFGYAESELLGRNVIGTIVPEVDSYGRNLAEMIEKIILSPDNYSSNTNENMRKDGERVWVSWSNKAIKNRSGKWEILCIGNDVTAARALEIERMKIRRLEALGVLAGGIAHDFNNLLAVIIGNSSLIAHGLSDKDIVVAAERISRAGNAAAGLVRKITAFAKGGVSDKTLCNVEDLLHSSIAATFGKDMAVRCRLNIGSGLWPIMADPNQIGQVFHNLLMNAIQAMPDGGDVVVEAENSVLSAGNKQGLIDGNYARIEFSDSGKGIAPEYLDRVFDPYFTTRELETGAGLGLAVAYALVRSHDGVITANSRLGVGTEMHVYLPAVAAGKPVLKKRKEKSPDGDNGHKHRVLFMDDEEPILEMASRMAACLGYRPELAGNGDMAIIMYKEALTSGDPFDLVVLDMIVSSGMGGVEAFGEIKKINPDVKAIVSSGYSAEVPEGFIGVLSKPYLLADMKSAFEKVLKGN